MVTKPSWGKTTNRKELSQKPKKKWRNWPWRSISKFWSSSEMLRRYMLARLCTRQSWECGGKVRSLVIFQKNSRVLAGAWVQPRSWKILEHEDSHALGEIHMIAYPENGKKRPNRARGVVTLLIRVPRSKRSIHDESHSRSMFPLPQIFLIAIEKENPQWITSSIPAPSNVFWDFHLKRCGYSRMVFQCSFNFLVNALL